MPPYHATIEHNGKSFGNIAVLPIKVTTKATGRGPAPTTDEEDIVDQTLYYFKSNILFKSYDMENDVDRVLVYLTLYIIECLKKLQKSPSLDKAQQDMYSMAIEKFSLPGEADFPLNGFFKKPSRSEEDELKKYLTQLRHETGARLANLVFDPKLSTDGKPSKWWTCWAKTKFCSVSLDPKLQRVR